MFFAILIAISLSLLSSAVAQFDPNKVHVVDVIGSNFLFRGNEPLNSTEGDDFLYQELVQILRQKAKSEANKDLPATFQLVDLCFLSPYLPWEEAQRIIEMNFFSSNPNLGTFFSWPLNGDVTSPDIYPSWLLEERAKDLPNWQTDQLPELMQQVVSILHNHTAANPVVIYFHCEEGSDRTGEFAASYYMQYSNMTLEQSLQLDDKIAGRKILKPQQWAAEWYCWYLKYALGYNLTCQHS